MSDCTIYHNPRCSKSRQTMALLEGRDIEARVVEYLQHTPTVEELDRICTMLDIEPLALIRSKEKTFSELGLSQDDKRTRQQWLELMVANPILIERPIVVCNGKAAIGRPPEQVLEIL